MIATLVAAVFAGAVSGQWMVPVLAATIAFVGRRRWEAPQAVQALLLVAAAFVAGGAVLLAPPQPDDPLRPIHFIVAGTCLLTMAVRAHLQNPERGHTATVALGFVVFIAYGMTRSGLVYPVALAAYLAGAAYLVREGGPRRVGVALAVLAIAAPIAVGSVIGVRKAYDAAYGIVRELSFPDAVAGFGGGPLVLGSMKGLLASNEVVLRVYGPADVHLRGNAYDAYEDGVWTEGRGTTPVASIAVGSDATIVEMVEPADRIFVPADAAAVQIAGTLSVDALGVPTVPRGEHPTEVRFTIGAPAFPMTPPTERDLAVAPEIVPALSPLAEAWTAGVSDPQGKLAAIAQHLSEDYVYSLHFDRSAEKDPTVEFLLESRLGHCEYFASAAAILARIAGIPARVVTGYRAGERSLFGGYGIVRSRDAHAWVEAWTGRWVIVDPSPLRSAEGMPDEPGVLSELWDAAIVLGEAHGLAILLVVLTVVFVALQIRTLVRGRRAPVVVDNVGPLAFMEALFDRLPPRDPAEPLELFATRLGEPASGLVRRYAAVRYGGAGDATLESDVARFVAR